jgi:hypothetical protein
MMMQILPIVITLAAVMLGFGIYMLIQSWVWKRQARKKVAEFDKNLEDQIKKMHWSHDQWCDSLKAQEKK